MDFRIGGKYFSCMRSPEGKDFYSTGKYRDIAKLQRIVVTDSFADEKGNVVPATHYGMQDDFPLETQITVTFAGQNGKTRMTLHHEGLPPGEMTDMCREGWSQSFDKLADSGIVQNVKPRKGLDCLAYLSNRIPAGSRLRRGVSLFSRAESEERIRRS